MNFFRLLLSRPVSCCLLMSTTRVRLPPNPHPQDDVEDDINDASAGASPSAGVGSAVGSGSLDLAGIEVDDQLLQASSKREAALMGDLESAFMALDELRTEVSGWVLF